MDKCTENTHTKTEIRLGLFALAHNDNKQYLNNNVSILKHTFAIIWT